MRQFFFQLMLLLSILGGALCMSSVAVAVAEPTKSQVVYLKDPKKINQQLTRTLFAAVIAAYIEEGDRQYRPFYLPQRQFLLAYLNAWGQALDQKNFPDSLSAFESLKSEYPLFRRYPEIWPSLYDKSSNSTASDRRINLGTYRSLVLWRALSTESWPLEKRVSQILTDLSSSMTSTQEDLRLAKVIAQSLVDFPFSEKIKLQAQGVLFNANFHRFTPMLAQMKNEVVFLPAAATVVKSLGSSLAVQNYFRQYQNIWFVQAGTKILRPIHSLVLQLKSALNPFYQKDPTLYKALGISLAAHGYVMAHEDFWSSQDLASSLGSMDASTRGPVASLAELWNELQRNYPALMEPVQFSKRERNYFLTSDPKKLSEKILQHFSSEGPRVNEFSVLLTMEKMKNKDERNPQDFFYVDVAASQLEVWKDIVLQIAAQAKDPSHPSTEEQDQILGQIQRVLIEGPLKKYKRDSATLGTSLNGWGGNCVAQTMMFSAMLKWIPWLQSRLAIALMPEHIEAVLIQKEGYHFLVENKVEKYPAAVVIYPGDYILKQAYNTLNSKNTLSIKPIYVGQVTAGQIEEVMKKFGYLAGIMGWSASFVEKMFQNIQSKLYRESVLSDVQMSQGIFSQMDGQSRILAMMMMILNPRPVPETATMNFHGKEKSNSQEFQPGDRLSGNFSDQKMDGFRWSDLLSWMKEKVKIEKRKPIRFVYRPENFSKEDYMEIAFVQEANQEYILELRTKEVYELFKNPKYQIYTHDFLIQDPKDYQNTIDRLRFIILSFFKDRVAGGYKVVSHDERAYVDLWLLYHRLELLTTAVFEHHDFEKIARHNYSPWKEERWKYLSSVLFQVSGAKKLRSDKNCGNENLASSSVYSSINYPNEEIKNLGIQTRTIQVLGTPICELSLMTYAVFRLRKNFFDNDEFVTGASSLASSEYYDDQQVPERWKIQGFYNEGGKIIQFPFQSIYTDWDWSVLRKNSERLRDEHQKISARGLSEPLRLIQGLVQTKTENESILFFSLIEDFDKLLDRGINDDFPENKIHLLKDLFQKQLNQLSPKDVDLLPISYLEARKQLKTPMPLSIELPNAKGTSLSLKFPVMVQNPEVGPTKKMPPQNTYLERQDGDPQGRSTKDSWGKSEQGQDLLDPRKKDRKIVLLPSIAEVVQDPKQIPRSLVSASPKVHFSPDDLLYLMNVWGTGLTLWSSEVWDTILLYLENSDKEVVDKTKKLMKEALRNYDMERVAHPQQVRSLSWTENQKKRVEEILSTDKVNVSGLPPRLKY